MLIAHVFDVTSSLKGDGENHLVVRLGSALREAQRQQYTPSLLGPDDRPESLWIRKAPHMYGWDIVPRIVSAGIWRSVRPEALPAIRIDDLYFWTESMAADSPRLGVHVQVTGVTDHLDALGLRLRGSCGEQQFEHLLPLEFTVAHTTFAIPGGRFWWPRDYGEPTLYTMEAELLLHEAVVNRRTLRIGLRQLQLSAPSSAVPTGALPSASTVCRFRSAAPTGCRLTRSIVGTASDTRPRSTLLPISTAGCSAVGAATCMRTSASSTFAMNAAYWCGRTSSLPAHGIPRLMRSPHAWRTRQHA